MISSIDFNKILSNLIEIYNNIISQKFYKHFYLKEFIEVIKNVTIHLVLEIVWEWNSIFKNRHIPLIGEYLYLRNTRIPYSEGGFNIRLFLSSLKQSLFVIVNLSLTIFVMHFIYIAGSSENCKQILAIDLGDLIAKYKEKSRKWVTLL